MSISKLNSIQYCKHTASKNISVVCINQILFSFYISKYTIIVERVPIKIKDTTSTRKKVKIWHSVPTVVKSFRQTQTTVQTVERR